MTRKKKRTLGVDPKFNQVADLLDHCYFQEDNSKLVLTSDQGDRLLISIEWIYGKVPSPSSFGDSWLPLRDELATCSDFFVVGDHCHKKDFIERTSTITDFLAEVVSLPKTDDSSLNYSRLSPRCQILVRNEKGFRKILRRLQFDVAIDGGSATEKSDTTASSASSVAQVADVDGDWNIEEILKSTALDATNAVIRVLPFYGSRFMFSIPWLYNEFGNVRFKSEEALRKELTTRHPELLVYQDGVHFCKSLEEAPDVLTFVAEVRDIVGTHDKSLHEVYTLLTKKSKDFIKNEQRLKKIIGLLPESLSIDKKSVSCSTTHRVPVGQDHTKSRAKPSPVQTIKLKGTWQDAVKKLMDSKFSSENTVIVNLPSLGPRFMFTIEWVYHNLLVQRHTFRSIQLLRNILLTSPDFWVHEDGVHLSKSLVEAPSVTDFLNEVNEAIRKYQEASPTATRKSACPHASVFSGLSPNTKIITKGNNKGLTAVLKLFPELYAVKKKSIRLIESGHQDEEPEERGSGGQNIIPNIQDLPQVVSGPFQEEVVEKDKVPKKFLPLVEMLIRRSRVCERDNAAIHFSGGFGGHFFFNIDWIYSHLDHKNEFTSDDLKQALKPYDNFVFSPDGNYIHCADILKQQPDIFKIFQCVDNYFFSQQKEAEEASVIFEVMPPAIQTMIGKSSNLVNMLRHFPLLYAANGTSIWRLPAFNLTRISTYAPTRSKGPEKKVVKIVSRCVVKDVPLQPDQSLDAKPEVQVAVPDIALETPARENHDKEIKEALGELQRKVGNDKMVLRLLRALSKSNVTSSGLAELVGIVEDDFGKSYDDVVEIESTDHNDRRHTELDEFYKLQPDRDQDGGAASVLDLEELEAATPNADSSENSGQPNVISKFFGLAKQSFQDI